LVTGGHPGDPEYGCGGTIAKFSRLGYPVTLLYLNRGEKGCGHVAAEACGSTRAGEAAAACRILGATPVFFTQVDGEAVVDAASYSKFDELVAQSAPELILAHWPVDNHRDHRAMAMLAYDAWLRMKTDCCFYYYEVTDGEDTQMFSPTDYVDITAEEPIKRQACFAHASQSPDHFYKLQSEIARFRGAQVHYQQAEAYIRHARSRVHPMMQTSAAG
jgi:LmbE family N-acetylglucosaminyl deacetylase